MQNWFNILLCYILIYFIIELVFSLKYQKSFVQYIKKKKLTDQKSKTF